MALELSDADMVEEGEGGGNITPPVESVPFVSRMADDTWDDPDLEDEDEDEDDLEEDEPEETPPAIAEPVAAPPVTVAAAPAPPPAKVEPPPAPTEYDGFPLNADGTDLHLDVLENPSSPEALEFKEQIGDAEYTKLMGEYQRAKTNYGFVVEASENAAIQEGSSVFATHANNTRQWVKEIFSPLDTLVGEGTADAIVADYDKRAGDLILQTRDDLARGLMQTGVPQHIAVRRANKAILSPPQQGQAPAYEQAFAFAIAGDLKGFLTRIVPATKAAAVPPQQQPAAPRTAPSAPPPALATSAGRAPAPRRAAPVEATDIPPDGLDVLKQAGIDPAKYAEWCRKTAQA